MRVISCVVLCRGVLVDGGALPNECHGSRGVAVYDGVLPFMKWSGGWSEWSLVSIVVVDGDPPLPCQHRSMSP